MKYTFQLVVEQLMKYLLVPYECMCSLKYVYYIDHLL